MPEDSSRRDWLATERTKLAAERTFLAYVRTALALLAAAAALLQFFPDEDALQITAIVLAAMGVLTLVVGIWRLIRVNTSLRL